MLRALRSCLIILSSIVLLSTSSYALTSTEFLYAQEDLIIDMCEDFEAKKQNIIRDNPFVSLFKLPAHYECSLTSFYALHKVTRLILLVKRGTDDHRFLSKLLTEYYIEEYDTYDFIAIHLEFEEYLEEKSGD